AYRFHEDPRDTRLPDGCRPACGPQSTRAGGRAPVVARPQTCRRRGRRLQPADELRARGREAAADARPPGSGCRERRVAGFLALALRLRQERCALLAAARARGGAGDPRRRDHQDAL
ncbi:MAG: hypothetical protein AVDCRST_MAG78-781, partial [uncultured Rubrobacteraceae bacterium]